MDLGKKMFFCMFSGQESKEIILKSNFNDDFFDVKLGIVDYDHPIKTNVKFGNRFYDVLFFDDGVNIVVSKRLFTLLKTNEITGWKTYPLNIKNVHENYYGFQIVGRCGKLMEPKNEGFYKGYKFDVETWDFSDFFSPKDTSLVFVNQKLKELFVENEITNIHLVNIKDVEAYTDGL
ncbi:hypothetical protein VP395_09485 [Mariniflexile soesokkakense]|uniref:Uncharacterized protein n=1 Tax=Mariniflexile soesokkakense TaxID=1343160 RepID=A0ABV0AA31_9FLAO